MANTNTQRALTVELRTTSGKGAARKLRQQGRIPGVLYGRGGEHLSLVVDPREFRKALDPERKLNTFFKLTVAGGGSEDAIVIDHQIDALRNELLHVDFLRVDPEREIDVEIPVRYVGRAEGVLAGGKLQTFRRSVKIAARPGDIPVELSADVSPIKAGEGLRIADVALPGARLREPKNLMLAFVEPPKARKEEEDPKANKAVR